MATRVCIGFLYAVVLVQVVYELVLFYRVKPKPEDESKED